MKKIFITGIVLLYAATLTNAQLRDTAESLYKIEANSHMLKAKKQKTTAWILLVGGAVGTTAGLIIAANEAKKDPYLIVPSTAPMIMSLGGGCAMLGSIPFLISSGKNKRKANLMIKSLPLSFAPAVVKKQMAVGLNINF